VRAAINDVTARTATSAGIPVQNLQITQQGNQVVITGSVGSMEDRQLIGERAAAAAGGTQVVNQLSIR
jgi:osmotically-inducible protein OsmY